MKKVWCFAPQSGGNRVPPEIQRKAVEQAKSYSATQKWFPRYQLVLRFKNQFCYIDAVENNKESFPVGLILLIGAWLFSLIVICGMNHACLKMVKTLAL
jgi:hypothetical protein